MSDTGVGMSNEEIAKMFEPFYTTKQSTGGSGLGLSMVYGIVKQSGGAIAVDSKQGEGTAISVYFPRIEGSVKKPQLEDTISRPEKGGENVLLVEDDTLVRELSKKVLEKAGYRVLVAADSDDATGIAGRNPGEIDLLVSDVVIPGAMNGPQLAGSLRKTFPELKVLFVSGYAENIVAGHGVPLSKVNLLDKPFSPSTLINKVREVLSS